MQDYLKLPDAGTDYVNDLGGHFPADRFFCMVGSNAADYSEFLSLSKRATGAMSDGLVMIKNATVKDAPRAFAHRSHSGHFGIVNSEEGYQNLRRFLFGQFRVDVRLLVDEITLPDPIQKAKDKGKQIRASYYIETRAGVRNAGHHLNQRSVSNSSAILRDYDSMVKQHNPVRLLSAYLLRSARSPDAGDSALAFAIRVGIQVPLYEVDQRFRFDEYYEGGYLFDETVTLKVRSGKEAAASVSYGLASRQGPGVATRRIDAMPVDPVKGAEEYLVPLGFRQGMTNPPRPGFRGKLQITVTPWNVNPG
jgi:hypothetical protein